MHMHMHNTHMCLVRWRADALPVDVFSAGLTLYAIWDARREETGTGAGDMKAVDDETRSEEAFEKIAAVKQAGELPAAWCERTPPQLASLVARMVRRDVASRPTARDCLQALLAAEGQPSSSPGAALASPAASEPTSVTHAKGPPKGAQASGRKGGGGAPRGLVHRMNQLDRVAKMQQALERELMEALSSCVMEDPPDPLSFVIERLAEAQRHARSVEPPAASAGSVDGSVGGTGSRVGPQ